MNVISQIVSFIGSLCLLLFGMNMLSNGIQKGTGSGLQKLLGKITGNRFYAVLTGIGGILLGSNIGSTVGFSQDEKLAGEAGNAIEQKIDETKKELKKASRKRLEAGADVKEELNYIDIVRKIERAGDCIYEISKSCNF